MHNDLVWPALTQALDDPTNPVRLEIDALIDRARFSDVQRAYREAIGPIVVESTPGVNGGTVGTAVDLSLRCLIDPTPNLSLATWGAGQLGPDVLAAASELATRLGAATKPSRLEPLDAPVTMPLQVPHRSTPDLVRTCWVLAWFVERYRSGGPISETLTTYLRSTDSRSADDLLALVTEDAVAEVSAIVSLAVQRLLPALASEPAPWFVGPSFTASTWIDADADLIAGHTLVELKTNLGTRGRNGARSSSLTMVTMRQLLGYVLHDVDDRYRLDTVALYDGRYGAVTVWPLTEMLAQVAGRPIDLPTERRRHRKLLTSGSPRIR